jgi:hypothetical protein
MPPDVVDVAFDAGRDAVQALFVAQTQRIAALEAEVEELKRLMGRSSKNSSLPPSRDSREARAERKQKRSSGKKQGGQEAGRAARAQGSASEDGRQPGPGDRASTSGMLGLRRRAG